jgi:hypothetical protein
MHDKQGEAYKQLCTPMHQECQKSHSRESKKHVCHDGEVGEWSVYSIVLLCSMDVCMAIKAFVHFQFLC